LPDQKKSSPLKKLINLSCPPRLANYYLQAKKHQICFYFAGQKVNSVTEIGTKNLELRNWVTFSLFESQICQIWPYLKLFARNEMFWPFFHFFRIWPFLNCLWPFFNFYGPGNPAPKALT